MKRMACIILYLILTALLVWGLRWAWRG
jgi:hypothetical protein